MDSWLTNDDLDVLRFETRDRFGPRSARPYVTVELKTLSKVNGRWLKDLPCPVIGMGSGPAAAFCDVVLEDSKPLENIISNIRKAPIAAMILVQQLRLPESLSPQDALTTESLAYAAVQTGPEFKRWLKTYVPVPEKPDSTPPLEITTGAHTAALTLSRPGTLNAIDTDMRDALCEALDMALLDESVTKITLEAKGRAFSVGGDINEFGQVSDPATAHWIRSLRLPAWRLARLKIPFHVHVQGAAVGAGAEIAAFGTHIKASNKAWFQLPELKYGLIPGAGGTVSLPRRIGRHRAAYMALSMDRISAKTALDWGLVDEIIP